MALRKDPQRRYASVQHFSEDIRRHLARLPVIARGDGFPYRTSKFIRRNKVGVAAATMILLTLVGGIVAVNQQRKRAERRFNDVRQLARSVVFDYHDAIADLPGSTPVRQRMVMDALKYLDSLASEASNDQTLQRELAMAYRKIGDVQGNSDMANLGDTTGALVSYRKSLAIRQALVEAESKNGELQSELAESYERIGDILRTTGDVSQADQNYEQAIRLLQSLPGPAREDRSQQRRLAELFYRVGNLKGYPRTANLGDTSGAVQYHRQALAIREALSAAAPSDIDLLIDLQESNRSLANILASQNDLIGAEPHARKAVSIAQGLVSTDLNSARSFRALTEATDSLARLLMRQGNLDQAAEVCRQSIDSAQAALSVDPKNMQARQDLASGHSFAGAIYLKKQDAEGALKHLRQSLNLNQAIAADDPNNDSAGRWVAQDLMAMGIALALAGDLQGALRSQKQGLAIFEASYQKKPDDTMAMNFLSTAHDRLAKTLTMLGDRTAALENFGRSVVLAERVLGQHPDNLTLRQQMALTHFNVGEIYFNLAERAQAQAQAPAGQRLELWSEARKTYQRSLDLLLELRGHGALSSEDAALPGQITKKIAACDAALARQPR
jgi:tetratricopeptide (TPR) repeat protein